MLNRLNDLEWETYGSPPHNNVMVHGGPGAAGELADLAKTLSDFFGIIEAFQRADTVSGQIIELKSICEISMSIPGIIFGWSWGAWLSLMVAAANPAMFRKILIVSCPPLEACYADCIDNIRLERLSGKEKCEADELKNAFSELCENAKSDELLRLFDLFSKADSYCPMEHPKERVVFDCNLYLKVRKEADDLRRQGHLLSLLEDIKCPIVAIHGKYDSHSIEGVRIPLSESSADYSFISLEKCGHYPWREKHARIEFLEILKSELI